MFPNVTVIITRDEYTIPPQNYLETASDGRVTSCIVNIRELPSSALYAQLGTLLAYFLYYAVSSYLRFKNACRALADEARRFYSTPKKYGNNIFAVVVSLATRVLTLRDCCCLCVPSLLNV